MTRWIMVADLRRCVGCQTCTAACRHANATPPGVQWRRVLDIEQGEYPDVTRAFVPVGCQHCDDPPCMDVCPTTATKKRADGIVTIDYDIASVAPTARSRARIRRAPRRCAEFRLRHGDGERGQTPRRFAARRRHQVHVLRRSDRCGLAQGMTPGVDPEATPACVNSCIAQALAFGDLDDPESDVAQLLARQRRISACTRSSGRGRVLLPLGSNAEAAE